MLFFLSNPGAPVYFFASLLHLAAFGGTGAEALKVWIDSIFTENGQLHLPEDGYKYKVATCTSEGGSVNFCKKTALMKRMHSLQRVFIPSLFSNNPSFFDFKK